MATGQRSPTAFWNQCLTSSVVSDSRHVYRCKLAHMHRQYKTNICEAAKICFIPGQNML